MDFAGSLEGLEPPPPQANVRIRPYVLGQTTHAPGSPALGDASVKVGGEASWAPGANSVLDLTYNTDFAQTDVDRQVVNLSRFDVYFPERRQFFLESAQVFNAGIRADEFTVQPFFSRRIGLDELGNPVPIVGGARFVSRSTSEAIGGLLIRQEGTDSQGPATFAVGRLNQNIGAGSRIGVFGAARFDEAGPRLVGKQSLVGAVDGLLRIGPRIRIEGSVSPFHSSDGKQGLGGYMLMARETPTVTAILYSALATKDYAPPTGFVSRTDTWVISPTLTADLRPRWRPRAIRSFAPTLASPTYLTPSTGALQQATTTFTLTTKFQSGAQVAVFGQTQRQNLINAYTFLPDVVVPTGRYHVFRGGLSALTDPSARWQLSLQANTGGFYDGSLTTVAPTLRVVPDPRLFLSMGLSVNHLRDVGSVGQRKTTQLVQPEIRLAINPRVTLGMFYQYNSTVSAGALNARFSWEFAPLSYVFLVYNDNRAVGTLAPLATPVVPTRQLVLKVSWLRQL
jgi:hypothetical protein